MSYSKELLSERRRNPKDMSINELEDYLKRSLKLPTSTSNNIDKAEPKEKSKSIEKDCDKVSNEVLQEEKEVIPKANILANSTTKLPDKLYDIKLILKDLGNSKPSSIQEKTNKILEDIKNNVSNKNNKTETNKVNEEQRKSSDLVIHTLGSYNTFVKYPNQNDNLNNSIVGNKEYSFKKETDRIIEQNNNFNSPIHISNNMCDEHEFNYKVNNSYRDTQNEFYQNPIHRNDILTLADLNQKQTLNNTSNNNFYSNSSSNLYNLSTF